LVRITVCQRAKVVSSIGPKSATPGVVHQCVNASRPFSTVVHHGSPTCCSSDTSQINRQHVVQALGCAVASSSLSRSTMATWYAFGLETSWVVAKPMPRAAPVTMAVGVAKFRGADRQSTRT
jgi:hypothetical protein